MKALVGYKGFITRSGIVRNEAGRLITQSERGGYMRVRLIPECGGRAVWRGVHCLVLETFGGPRPSLRHHCAHVSGNRANNRLSNLAWKTPEENEADKRRHGTSTGGKVGAKRMIETNVDVVHRLHWHGWSYTRIALMFHVHRHTISRIVRGQRHA